jgi:hypothetical protein
MKEVAKKAGEKPAEKVTTNAVTPPAVPVAKPLTRDEWFVQAPAEVRAVLTNAIQVAEREKARLIEQLTANVARGQEAGAGRPPGFWRKSLDELRDLAGDCPGPDIQNVFPPIYAGDPLAANAEGRLGQHPADLPRPVRRGSGEGVAARAEQTPSKGGFDKWLAATKSS